MTARERIRLDVRGHVQGVGFRPFACQLARQMGLGGWVRNTGAGATVEVEGALEALDAFAERLAHELPAPGAVWSAARLPLAPLGEAEMRIAPSAAAEGAREATVLPDVALCAECRGELFDPANRRYRYPFISCARCGPRFSIVRALPFDRTNTTMSGFALCPACRAEYEDPRDRRFHAQTIACADCGPRLALWSHDGQVGAADDAALRAAACAIALGEVVALKGLGGFQLLVDARNADAVRRLRERKHRPAKPFAVMFPSLAALRRHCEASPAETALLTGAASPIVLLRRRSESALAPAVAPGNPLVGAMLPYTPLHALLLARLDAPVVATSGNLSGEPLCTDEREAIERLGGIAECFLVHDRPIARPLDDSVVRVMGGRPAVLRLARGHAPLPVRYPLSDRRPVLALGGHMKSAVALSTREGFVLGPHIGDLESSETIGAFERAVEDMPRLYGIAPQRVAHDAHPDYVSTRAAQVTKLPCTPVQHHLAHVLACLAEHGLDEPALGVAWDGAGDGTDGTAWGGEFLVVEAGRARRVAHLRHFRLPGGDAAAREPRRAALGALAETFGDNAFTMQALPSLAAFRLAELRVLRAALARGVNAPLTSSAGRLFDAVASIAGLVQRQTFEGEAAMALEFAAERYIGPRGAYPCAVEADGAIDWRPMLRALTDEAVRGEPMEAMAARFHETLVELIVRVAGRHPDLPVVLTGGCFQNRTLLERSIERLRSNGRRVIWHERVPPNDGGLALGQALAAQHAEGEASCA